MLNEEAIVTNYDTRIWVEKTTVEIQFSKGNSNGPSIGWFEVFEWSVGRSCTSIIVEYMYVSHQYAETVKQQDFLSKPF